MSQVCGSDRTRAYPVWSREVEPPHPSRRGGRASGRGAIPGRWIHGLTHLLAESRIAREEVSAIPRIRWP